MASHSAGHRLPADRGGVKLKTFTRMIGRYVLATAAVVLLVVGLLGGLVGVLEKSRAAMASPGSFPGLPPPRNAPCWPSGCLSVVLFRG